MNAPGAWWFTYGVTTASIAQNAIDTPSIAIGGDADFILMGIGASATFYDFTLTIDDGSGARRLMNDYIHARAIVGSNQSSASGAGVGTGVGGVFWLPVPYRFQANNQIQLQVKNLNATATTVYFGFTGIKISAGAPFQYRLPGGQVVNI